MSNAENCLMIRGALNMSSVPTLFQQGLQQLAQGDLCVDFSGAEGVDSAAVSMMLGWMRAAQLRQRGLSFRAMPPAVLSLATLYGVADLLPASA